MKELLFLLCIISSIANSMHLEVAKAHWVFKVRLKRNTEMEYVIKEVEKTFSAKDQEVAFYRFVGKKVHVYLNAKFKKDDIKSRLSKNDCLKEVRVKMQEAMPVQESYTQ